MKFKKYSNTTLLEMANVRGCQVVIEDIPFSFYFSSKFASESGFINHGIRAKIVWNREKMNDSLNGFIKLHGGYEYVGRNKKQVSSDMLNSAVAFFKKYKVLFAAVWEGLLQEDVIQDYFRGLKTFDYVLDQFDLDEDKLDIIQDAGDISELEKIVRDNNLFNMND